jgi:hypothetical protein
VAVLTFVKNGVIDPAFSSCAGAAMGSVLVK